MQTAITRKRRPAPVAEEILQASRSNINIDHSLHSHVSSITPSSTMGYRLNDQLQFDGLRAMTFAEITHGVEPLGLEGKIKVNLTFIYKVH